MRLNYFGSLLLTLSSFFSWAQSNTIVIVSENGNPFTLKINQEIINQEPQSIVKAFDLAIGWHVIDINSIQNNNTLLLKDSILISDKSKFLNKEFTYALTQNEGILKLVFKSVSEQSGPATPVIPEAPKEKVPLVDNSLYGNLYQAKNNKPIFFNNYNQETSSCSLELSNKEINYAINLLTKCNDSETKVRYMHEIIEKNCYTTDQVKHLLELLTIDIDKLDIAKKAYRHITDKQNTKSLLTSFKFKSMQESFQSFLKDEENIVKQKNLQCKTPIDNKAFENVLQKIKQGGLEYEKVVVAKKQMANICISTSQAKSIAQFFNHDRETIEVLKSAYYILTDKENAKDLITELQFKESQDDFLKYISKQ